LQQGLALFDHLVGSTNVLIFGTLLTPKTFIAGDELIFVAGALTVVLS
jgi:hypothetical protein